ncbi:diguanylate cyclase domain-containing protein [Simiduia aestuariiviva]|uniref:Diguanylate cyclase (GGDEF)-like protein n=1 Tax=Simiduia aestuariiviva TaxID=1510459 RepID=A0A839UK16_9GAMM|nr:diguanylate cyclase [Simiduia aestuariiviva]MBB3167953.1 diguanylate cyclase (GGDEF)-like protein [Simiduia aestuariiviva]
MTISARIGVLFLAAGLLLSALIASIALALEATVELNKAQTKRFVSYQLADELRHSSDDLTRMVRSYIVTGDRNYYHHFNRIQEIRDGSTRLPQNYSRIYWNFVTDNQPVDRNGAPSISLIDKMKQAEFRPSELSLLAQAKRESDALIRIEDQAMLLMDKFTTQQARDPSSTDLRLREEAINLVFNSAYHQAKSRIMRPIQLFYESVDKRTLEAVEAAQQKQKHYFSLSALLIAIMACFSVFAFFHLRRQLTLPLSELLKWVEGLENSRFDLRKASERKDEFGRLENAFIKMAGKINTKIAALQDMAGKDSLTGAASLRRGRDFFELCARAAERSGGRIAIVFLDFNDFKPINDHYGHAAGDHVLITSVKRLQNALRINDLVCRIGGDEFIVIMPDITVGTPPDQMIDKVQQTLTQPVAIDGQIVDVSVSCGIAIYPEQARKLDQLIAVADKAMYAQKNQRLKAPAGAFKH